MKLDIKELKLAFTNDDFSLKFYLERETGRLCLVDENYPQLGKDIVDNKNFIEVEPLPSYTLYEIKESFLKTLTDEETAKQLKEALHTQNPEESFLTAIHMFPEDIKLAWYIHYYEELKKLAVKWLQGENIDAEIILS